MSFTAKDVQELRARTGAGMMDCKKALQENGGNMDAAIDYLRKKGIAKAETRAGRSTSEGAVVAETSDKGGVIVELNCETDFVARTDDFQAVARRIAQHALATPAAKDAAAVLASSVDGKPVEEVVKEASAKLGETLNLRRVARLDGTVGKYVHFNGKIGVIVAVSGAAGAEAQGLANVVAEHVAATNPLGIDESTVPPDVIARERAIYEEQTRASGKPEAMIEKIVEGKVKAYYKEVALLHQAWIREPKQTISQVVAEAGKQAGAPITVMQFVRFQLGQE
jgi:elongation factor Ts